MTQLEVGDVEGQALGGEEYVAAAIPWWVPVAAGLGLAGLIAGISGSGSDDRPEPAPIVSLSGVKSLSEATATNDANTAIYSVTLDKASDVDTSVTVTITPGSANGGDYTAPTTQTITIPAGQTSVNFSIPIVNDNVYEGAQSFMVAITSVSAGKATIDPVKNVVTTTVYDDGTIDGTTPVDPNDPTVGDDTPIVSIKGTVNLSETAADGSVNSATYTVSLSNPSAVDTTISYIISDGSTEGSDDYVAPTIKTVTIPAGQTSVDFSLPMVDDSIYEGAEDFTVTITGTTAGTANISADNDSVTTTIYDNGTTDGTTPVNPADPTVGNDIPVVSIAATDAQAIEGVDNTLIFSVTQTNLSNLDTTVNVSLGAANTVEAADIASISYTNATGVVVSLTTATQIQDFLANGASVTIPAGETAAPVITVTIADDVVYEQSEDLVLEIGSPVNATIGTNSATGVILDESNDPANPGSNTEGDKPVVSVSDATTDEGGDLVHTVTLSNPTEVAVSYPFAITDGSATTATGDYSNAPVFSDGVVLNTDGSITIPAGVTNFTVSYPALNDDLDELNETTTLTIGTGVGTGTITDTDVAPIISISATDATGIEGVTDDTIVFSIDQAGLSDRATSVIATLNLTDAEAADIDSILLTNADGSTQTISVADAIAGVTVSIPAGTLLADMPSFSITPAQDAIYEISETIGMSLSSPVNAALGTATASAEILDEDGGAIDAPVVSIAATDAQAIEGVDNTLIFSVTQTNLSNLDTTVNVSLGAANTVEAADIASISYTNATGVVVSLTTATQIQDFLANGASVTIPAGETAAPVITVTIADDVVYEQSEDLVLEIGSPVNATIGTNSATGVILDESNDPANPGSNTEGDKPVVSVSDATTDEGGDLVHTVTLSNPTEVAVSYPFAITDGSATTATGDYSNAPVFSDGVVLNTDGSITIPAGVTNFTVSYPALNDDLDELNETTTLTIGTGVGTGTITDTDVAPIISISATDATGIEGVTDDTIVFSIDQAGLSDRATSVIATLNLTDAEAADIDSILLTNADGSTQTISVADAIAGVTVSIPAGTLLADMPSFSITPAQDAIYEISETIGMSLSSPVNAALGTATASAEILDEDGGAIDAPVVSIAATDAQAIEGVDNTLIFSVTQTNLSNLDTTVNVSLGAANTVEAADIASISYTNATGVVVTLDNLTDIQAFLTNGATVTIPAGSTSAPAITVTVIDDVVYERSEDLVLNIAIPTSSPTAATVGTGSTTGVILDEDQRVNTNNLNNPDDVTDEVDGDKPVVSVSDATTDEGGDLVHTVTLSNPTEVAVSYPFAITDGSATTATGDYSNAPVFSDGVVLNTDGSITIPAGVTNFTVSYPALNDDLDELNETTTLTIGTGVGTGTITDTDVAPIISISATDATGIEGVTDDTIVFSIDQAGLSDRATSVIATLNLTDAEAADIDSILLTNADGSTQTISVADAIAGVTVSIPAGTLLADMPSFSITPAQDAIYEISETIGMSLSSPVNAALGTATASAEILDEDGGAIDAPVVSIAATDAQAIEGVDNTLIFSVTQTNLSNLDTTVNVSLGAANTVEAADIASISYTNATGVVVSLTTATQIQDFLANGASVTIPAGETAAPVITVTIADDVVYEQSEDLVLEIGSPVNATIGTNSATGVILDESNDPANPGSNTEGDKPVVSVSDATTDEGGDLVHTVTLSNPTEVAVSYPFAITDGSATTATGDYSNAPVFSDGVVLNTDGSITIPAGVTNFTVSYPALNDDLDELNETTTLTIGTGVGTGTITDTDVAPIISISATDATGIEGVTDDTIVFSIDQAGLSDRATSVIATLNLTDAEAADIDSILLTNADGSTQTISVADAIAGVTVSIPAGTLLADMPSFSITPAQDAIYEISETIGMSLSSPVNAALGTATASAEILDEDGGAIDAPVVSIAATDAQAIEGVDNTLIFSVTQTNLSNLDTTVNVSLGAANTVEAADIASISYTNATGVVVTLDNLTDIQAFLTNGATVTIPAGSTSAPAITVTVIDDVVYERSEDLVLNIAIPTSSPTAATVGTGSTTGVILDEDQRVNTNNLNNPDDVTDEVDGDKPVVSVSDATTDEGGDLVHTVTLSNPTEVAVSYPFAITDGSATTATGDYSNAPVFSDGVVLNTDGSITIPAGVTNFTVSYPALNDDLDELNETTTLTIGTGVGTGTITDTDVAPIISISATDATGIEGVTDDTIVFSIDQAGLSDRATSVIATLNLTDAEAADIDSILLTNADGSTQTISVADAIAGVTVSIPAGTLLADMPSFSITPAQDAIYEISETIGMSLSSPVNAALGTATASAEILDEDGGAIDAPVVSIAATDAQAIEGVDNTLIFSVTQTNLSNLDTTVNVSLGAANTVEAADIASISYTNATGVVVTLDNLTDIQAFLTNGATVTIPAGSTSAPAITVTVIDDVVYERSEDLVLNIAIPTSSPTAATVGTGSATGVILDEDQRVNTNNLNNPDDVTDEVDGDKPVVSVSDATTDEGGDLVHTVTLSNPTEVAVSYPFAITDGSATTATGDYSNAPVFSDGVVLNTDGSITIPAGVTNFTVSYPALNDDLDELNETTTLTIGTGVGTGTITDTDVAPIISISATDATGIEGVTDDTIVFSIDQAGLSDRATSVIATLNLTDAEAADIDSILLTNADGSTQTISVADAIAGVTVSIPAGTLLADMPSFSITPAQDAIYEISETIGMSLSSPVNAALGTATASAEILDEDGGAIDAPVVSIAATDAQAIEGVDNTLIFSVTQTNLSNLDTTVNVSLGAANTVEAADIASISYTNATGVVVTLDNLTDIQAFLTNGATVTIPAGSTSAPAITVTVIDDVVYERSEDLVLNIAIPTSSPTAATVGTGSATGVILDEDQRVNTNNLNNPDDVTDEVDGDKPVVSVSDATTDEGGDLVHTVTLSNPTEVAVSYPFAITDGSATTATGDYSNAPVFSDGVVLNTDGSITIPAGVTNFTVSYPALNDDLDELNETTTLTIGTGVGTGTITDTDVAPIISISATDATGIEGVTDDTIVFSIDQAGLSDRATSVIATLNLTDAEAADIDSILLTNADGSTQTISVADAIAGVTVSIPAGTLLADMPSFSITPAQDAIYEISETIGMSLSSPVNAALGTATASAEILDEDGGAIDAPVVSIAATDAQAIEGVDNTLIFSVTQTNLSNLDTTVNVSLGAANTVEAADIASISYTNATGVVVSLTTATQIQDFLANGASVTIPAGETAAPVITVTIADDVVYEQSEDLVLEIGSPVNATIGTNSATGVILDESNDPANPGSNTEGDKPVVSVSDATTDEGGDLVHTVTLSNPTEVAVSYPFAITDGSATTATGDYSNAPVFSDGVVLNTDGSITIPAGVTNFTVSYPALNDDLDELNETTTLTIGTGVGTGTITDTDVAPIISISATDATGIEGVTDDTIVFSIDQAGLSDRATSVIATLNLTDAEAADIDSILLTNADGSTQTISVADAIAGVTVSIPAGTLLADMPSFSITPAQDAIYEISETIGMSLSSPVNAALGTATASAEILDEDGGAIDAPVVSIAATDAQAIEGVDNTLIFSVTQTNLSNLDTTVNVSLGAANTVEAADIASISYTNATGVVVTLDNLTDIQAFLTNGATVTIPAGSTSAPAITVTVIDDVVYERSEDLVLNIAIPTSSPTAATVGTGSTTGVILDEDQRVNTNNLNNPDDVTDEVDGDKPVVSVSDATTDEGGDLVHTVTLSNPTEVAVSYPFAITDGSATTATGDYSNAPVFSDGVVLNTDGSITIPAGVTNFTVSYPALNDDLDELNETTTLTIGTGVGTGTITDTDVAPIISISATDATGIEGVTDDTIVFSIDQAGLSDRATSVIATLNLTDAEAADIDSILLTNADGSTQTISVADAIAGVTVSIPAGTLLADMPSFSITPAQDAIYEISETIGMSLSSPVNAALGTATASAEILDEDGGAIDAPVVSIAATDAQAIEGVDNTLIFSVTQTNLSNLDTTVNVSLGAANTVEAADIASISYTNATGVVVTLDNLTDIQAFLTNGATVTIPAGSTSAPAITVTVIDDVVYERSEDLVLNIAIPTSSPTAATVGTGSTTGVILDEDQRVNTNNLNNPDDVTDEVDGDKPVVSVSDATTDEGGDLVHTVTLSNPTEVAVSYPFAITDGSATTATGDYSNAPVFSDGVVLNTDGSITIPAGVTNFTVSYPALNDDLDELNETTTLTIGTGVGTGTITDTDVAPIISISATDATGIEGVTDDTIVFSIDQAGLSDRATSVIATLNLTDAEAADIDSILLTNADGSTQTISVADAIAGVTVSIPAGTLLADMPSFSITPAQDAIYEISETIGMSLSSPVNAALGTATASAEILDEDGGAIDAPVVSIAATDAQAIEGVDNTLIFSVTQTNLSNLDTTVNVSLGAANTVEAADIASISYTNATGVVVTLDNLTDIQAFLTNGATVTIPAGSTSAPAITVTVIDDVVYERSEDLVLNIAIPTSSPTAATVGTGSATGVILDEDQRVNTNNLNNPDDVTDEVDGDKPVVSVSDATTDEGGDLVHTVTLSNPTEVAVSYPFAITDGSATTATGDYSNAPVFSDGVVLNTDGSITIPAGVTNFTVSYPALNDDLDELNETTTLTIGTGVGTGTITDTDVAPIISISATDATGIEGVTDDTIVFSIDQAGLSDRATSVIATLNLTDAEAADIDSILLTNADGSTQTISVADAIAGVTVSIPAGTLLADMPSFSITPAQDAIYEISETIGMSLSSPVNAALGTATASAEILDEDGGAIDAPVVSIAATDAQAIEGVDNTLIFSVTQTNLSNLDTTVNVSLGAANTVEAADIASISYTNATGVVV
uniref:Calx-beta domain-containing protein n=1 Tax=Psychrobacter sp. R86515 TaxID=3093855 RepID=UPI0036D2E263